MDKLDADVEIISVRENEAPMYSPDIGDQVPADIHTLFDKLAASDANFIASPEYNGSMPSMLKNVVDWLSWVKPGQHWLPGPLLLMGASPGPTGGSTNIASIAGKAGYWGATVAATFKQGSFGDAFDPATGLSGEDEARLETALDALRSAMA